MKRYIHFEYDDGGDATSIPSDLTEYVAKAMVNADLDSFGRYWPWPEGNSEVEKEVREQAMELAEVAIRAIFKYIYKGNM